MNTKYHTIKIFKETNRLIKKIQSETDESKCELIARLVNAEFETMEEQYGIQRLHTQEITT